MAKITPSQRLLTLTRGSAVREWAMGRKFHKNLGMDCVWDHWEIHVGDQPKELFLGGVQYIRAPRGGLEDQESTSFVVIRPFLLEK